MQLGLSPCMSSASAQRWTYDAAAKTIATQDQCLTLGGGGTGTAVIGRPLSDGSWALAFLNSGATNATVTCDGGCMQQTGWEAEQVLGVRDLWAHSDGADVTAGGNFSVALQANGGSAMFRFTPKFNATIPT